jgi:hydroxyacylglutathione hydrolase
MKINTLILGPLNTNCCLVIDELSQQCLIIDPADDAELISEEILRQNLQPMMIIATHGHFDHIMAASALQINFDLPFLVHEKDKFLVEKMKQSIKYWLKMESELEPPKITGFLTEGHKIEFGQTELRVMHVPGHTPGGVCLVEEKEKLVFTGDTLFADGIGRTDFSYSLPGKMEKSLGRIRSELSGYQAYAGHGEEFVV